MVVKRKTELTVQRKFDPKRCRHYINDSLSVLHCHHYATLYTQLAIDAEIFDGKKVLRDSSEHTFYQLLKDYLNSENITCLEDKIKIVEEYWAFAGMGQLNITMVGEISGRAEMENSHIDEGWIKKWGHNDEPVNYITQGYLATAFALFFDCAEKSYDVIELQGIVTGASKSVFSITRK